MQLTLSWIVFPAVLWVLSLGLGRVVAAVAGVAVPLPVLVPTGFAALVVVGTAITATPAASLTTPLVVALAAIGLCVTRPRWPTRSEAYALAAAGVVLLAYGAPVLSSGTATFTGYIKLDDTATFLAFVDQLFSHGTDFSQLAPSSHEATLAVNLGNGYPVGTFMPLGVGSQLIGSDPAWLWQPAIAFSAAMLCLALFSLTRSSGLNPVASALVSGLAAQAALLYGYGLWGGAKEVVGAGLLALGVATTLLTRPLTARSALVPATAGAAFLAVMSIGGLAWLAPATALFVLGAGRNLRAWVALLVLTAALAIPTLREAVTFLSQDTVSSLRSDTELGNLAAPLSVRQILGVWPAGDFRAAPSATWATVVLLALVLWGIGAGFWLGSRTRQTALAALAVSVVLPCVVFVAFGSPWIGGKALAMSAPAVLALGLAGLLGLQGTWRVAGLAAAGLVAGGVLWSNTLQYREVWLAPYGQLRELEMIGEQFAGQGPALMTEYNPNAVRHFLRRLDAEGASELRRRLVPLATGRTLDKAEFADIDELELASLTQTYPLLVLRRSPVGSRPPGAYQLALRGAWYDVWQRAGAPQSHLSLGTQLVPVARPACAELSTFAAGSAAIRFPAPVSTVVGGLTAPAGWSQLTSGVVVPSGGGELAVQLSVPAAGRYGVWIGGSFRGTLHATIGGASPATTLSARNHLNPSGMWLRLGEVDLAAGSQLVTLRLESGGWRGGSSGPAFPLGPFALAQEPQNALHTRPSTDPNVCEFPYDWVER